MCNCYALLWNSDRPTPPRCNGRSESLHLYCRLFAFDVVYCWGCGCAACRQNIVECDLQRPPEMLRHTHRMSERFSKLSCVCVCLFHDIKAWTQLYAYAFPFHKYSNHNNPYHSYESHMKENEESSICRRWTVSRITLTHSQQIWWFAIFSVLSDGQYCFS